MNQTTNSTATARLDDEVDIFTGQVTAQTAKVYVRCANLAVDHWQGSIEGPYCDFAETLTSRAAVTDLGPGECKLAMARIVDPCLWTPLHPSYYRLHLQYTIGARTESLEREFGICGFAVRDTSFRMESKRWVLRGVHGERWTQDDLMQCRETLSGVILDVSTSGTDELETVLGQTSRLGVPVAANVLQTSNVQYLLRRLARYPSVVSAILPSNDDVPELASRIAPNICLAQSVDDWQTIRPRPWSTAYCWNVPPEWSGCRFENLDRPLLALRKAPAAWSSADKRAACDTLQRDLAGVVECSGFLV